MDTSVVRGTGAASSPGFEPVLDDERPAALTQEVPQGTKKRWGRKKNQLSEEPQPPSAASKYFWRSVFLLPMVLGVWLLWQASFAYHNTVASLATLVAVWVIYVALLQEKLDDSVTRPHPTMGWQRQVHFLLRFVLCSYVPERSVAEEYAIACDKHFELAQTRTVFFGVISSAGGVGKSTTTVVMAWISALASKLPTLLVDARGKMGNIPEYIGLWRRRTDRVTKPSAFTTPTIRQAIQLAEDGWLEDSGQNHKLFASPPGMCLRVIGSDQVADDINIPASKLELLWSKLRQFTVKFAETADVIGDPFNHKVMELCDVPVFVHLLTKPNSLGELRACLAHYCKDDEFARKICDHGVLMVLAAQKSDTPQVYSEKVDGIIPPERVFLVRYDKFFTRDNTDEGHVNEGLRDESRYPSQTIDLHRVPVAALRQFMLAMNAGMATLPPDKLRPSHVAGTSSDYLTKEGGGA